MEIVRRISLAGLALVLFVFTAPAQDAVGLVATPAASVTAPILAVEGPRLATARVGASTVPSPVVSPVAPTVASTPETAPMRKADTQRSRTLMIIGGAALLGGAIIGDDVGSIIMLGGLGVGLYGLYLFLQ